MVIKEQAFDLESDQLQNAYALGSDVNPALWIRLLIVYDVVFVTVSFLTFGYILQE